jgi:hypothetical protein
MVPGAFSGQHRAASAESAVVDASSDEVAGADEEIWNRRWPCFSEYPVRSGLCGGHRRAGSCGEFRCPYN